MAVKANQVTYRPQEKKSMGLLSAALHAGLDPNVGQDWFMSNVQSEAQQRLAEMEARRQAQQQAAQQAAGQLGATAIQLAQSNPTLTPDQLSGMLGAQEQALGLGPKIAARVDSKVPGLVGSVFSGGSNVFAPVTASGLDPQTESTINATVAGAVQSGEPMSSTMNKLKAAAIADGQDPQAWMSAANAAYSKMGGVVGENPQVQAWAANPDQLRAAAAAKGVVLAQPTNGDWLPIARQFYAATLGAPYGGQTSPNPYLSQLTG